MARQRGRQPSGTDTQDRAADDIGAEASNQEEDDDEEAAAGASGSKAGGRGRGQGRGTTRGRGRGRRRGAASADADDIDDGMDVDGRNAMMEINEDPVAAKLGLARPQSRYARGKGRKSRAARGAAGKRKKKRDAMPEETSKLLGQANMAYATSK